VDKSRNGESSAVAFPYTVEPAVLELPSGVIATAAPSGLAGLACRLLLGDGLMLFAVGLAGAFGPLRTERPGCQEHRVVKLRTETLWPS
jgi:hypothetical protein